MKKDQKCNNIKHEKIAPGMDNALEKKASEEEKECGETTRVTRLSWDETDPS